MTCADPVTQIAGLFTSEGAADYLGEPVTQAAHTGSPGGSVPRSPSRSGCTWRPSGTCARSRPATRACSRRRRFTPSVSRAARCGEPSWLPSPRARMPMPHAGCVAGTMRLGTRQLSRRVMASRSGCGHMWRRSYVLRRSFGLMGRPERPSRAEAAARPDGTPRPPKARDLPEDTKLRVRARWCLSCRRRLPA